MEPLEKGKAEESKGKGIAKGEDWSLKK